MRLTQLQLPVFRELPGKWSRDCTVLGLITYTIRVSLKFRTYFLLFLHFLRGLEHLLCRSCHKTTPEISFLRGNSTSQKILAPTLKIIPQIFNKESPQKNRKIPENQTK